MKISALSLPVLALVVGSALAQQPPDGPPGPGRMGGGPPIERLTRDLNLSVSQQASVKQILDTQRAQMDAERKQVEASGTRPTREEMMAKRQANDAQLKQQLSLVLTSEQLAKFEALRQRRGPPPGPPPAAP